MDPQGNATSGYGLNRQEIQHCIYDVLIDGAPLDGVILPTAFANVAVGTGYH